MADGESAQQYVVFDAKRLMERDVTEPLTPASIDGPLWGFLDQLHTDLRKEDYTIESVPLVTFHPGDSDAKPPFTPQAVFSVSFPAADLAERLLAAEKFRAAVDAWTPRDGTPLLAIGVNPVLTLGDYSCPEGPDGAVFGTLDDARRLVKADQLPPALDGRAVNVVVIDSGIDRHIVPRGQYGGGWVPQFTDPKLPPPPPPGQTTGKDALHGMMVVNNILSIAPRATIFDVPLIPPPKIYDIPTFLHAAEATFQKILEDVRWFRIFGPYRGPWVFINAWAIFDRRSEGAYLGEYTENRAASGHPFIRKIVDVAQEKIDMVFCAGNCGRICPDGRCGPDDFGPGRSIWGANAHQDVLTLGAVRVDAVWPGYSSEGPGPTPYLYAQKPDLCAPSQFAGASGRYPPNTGTSASAALAAAVVCALRSKKTWNQATVPPYILKLILNNMAMKPVGMGWDPQLGNGILDAFAAYQKLLANFP